jgi:hypothetical protein
MDTKICSVHASPVNIAELIARAMQQLNLATLPDGDGFTWPSEVSRVVASLQLATARLSQTLAQSEQWIDEAMDAGRVGHDMDDDARQVVDDARKWLSSAIVDASTLARSLDVVHEFTAQLTGIVPGGGEC